MKTTIVSPQIPLAYRCGGIGTFVWHFSKLLRSADHELTIIYTEPPQTPIETWMPEYEKQGIKVVSLNEYSLHRGYTIDLPEGYPRHGYHVYVKLSELVADAVPPDADIVYLADWRANGFHMARSRRYSRKKLPLLVTVLHGGTAWHREGMQLWPSSYEDVAMDFLEKYVAQYSDFVVAPSRYMYDWVHDADWRVPSDERTRIMPYPFVPDSRFLDLSVEPGNRFKRVVFYGRLETRKGFDLFVQALLYLKGKPCLDGVEEVTFLGYPGNTIYGEGVKGAKTAAGKLRKELGVGVVLMTDSDTFDAQDYLARRVADTLVVTPSRAETVGFTIVESSLIPGLNILCTNVGGIPDALGPRGGSQLFEPYVEPTRAKIEEWLSRGPRPASELGSYDWTSANQGWLGFHHELCERVSALKEVDNAAVSFTEPAASPKSVDVCVPYYNLGAYLPMLLESLAQQTTSNFNVFVLNDGSTDPHSITVFENMKAKYAERGWYFASADNRGLSMARNILAALGWADYICFIDADNIAAPNMVERFLTAIRTSGDDCLTCYLYAFKGETPYLTHNGATRQLRPAEYIWVPFGNAPAVSILYNCFGDANCIIRRAVFEALAGFACSHSKFITGEERELFTSLALAGYRLDVIPEFLFYYRHRENSMLRTTEPFQNDTRVLRIYRQYLRKVGLEEAGPLLLGLHYWVRDILQVGQQRGPMKSDMDYLLERTGWMGVLRLGISATGGIVRMFARDARAVVARLAGRVFGVLGRARTSP